MNPRRGPEPERLGHCDWTDQPPATSPPPAAPAPLPQIPAGTRLSLRPDDWYSKPGVRAIYYRDLLVVSVHPENTDAAWVYAHEMECSYASSDCTKPWCQEVRVSLGALWLVADQL